MFGFAFQKINSSGDDGDDGGDAKPDDLLCALVGFGDGVPRGHTGLTRHGGIHYFRRGGSGLPGPCAASSR